MHTHTKAYTKNFHALIDKPLNVTVKRPLVAIYRIVLATSPVVVASYFYNFITPAVVFFTIWLLYRYMKPLQPDLYELTANEIYFFVALPLYGYVLLWAGGLYFFDRPDQILKTVGGVFLLCAASVYPVFMSEKKKKLRKFKFDNLFYFVSAIVVFQQFINIWGYK